MSRLMLVGAIAPARPAPPGTPRHRQITGGAWTGLVIELPAGMDLDRADDAAALAQAQHAILCHYVADGDILPVAIGAVFSDETAISAHLEARTPDLDALAIQMAGHVEYRVILSRPEDTPAGVARTGGAEHLRSRRAKRDRLRNQDGPGFLSEMVTDLRGIPKAFRLRGAQSQRIASIDLLVRRELWPECLGPLDARAEQARTRGLVLTATGPYPPFSFLEDRSDA